MNVVKFWSNGSHVVSLNWQKFDRGMQLNEAMFVGTGGWVLKPPSVRGLQAPGKGRRKNLVGEIAGISACKCAAHSCTRK